MCRQNEKLSYLLIYFIFCFVGLTIEDIIAETTNFFTTGHEKTYVVLQFCLYELACNPTVQERLFQEIQEVLQKHNNDMKFDALDDLTYLDQVVNG